VENVNFLKLTCLATSSGPTNPDSFPNPNPKDERHCVPQPPKDRNAKLASCTGYSTKSHDTIDRRLYASKLHCIMQETTAIYRRTASPFFKPRTEKWTTTARRKQRVSPVVPVVSSWLASYRPGKKGLCSSPAAIDR